MTAHPQPPVYFLLVDDLEENLMSLEALLRREGLICLKARSGTEALEILLSHEVALALLDVQMPGMDGFELAELMRGTERTRRVPIIFLTAGTANMQRRFRGYEAGAVDFLQKPIAADILRSKASVFFDLYSQNQQVARQRDELRLVARENERLLQESQSYAHALKEADRRKDEFLAMLAHELRNPLAPIRNGLQVLQMSPDQKISAEIRDMMGRQLTHLVRLIDDLLDVSRVSQGKIELRREPIKLQAALQAAIEASRPLIEAAHHSFTLTMQEDVLWVDADLTRLAQVVSNLLNNAAKYTPEGGHITLNVSCEDEEVAIAVSDNGLGINAEMLPKIFELFTQVDANLERSQGGLGIGLALVKQLVQMHGGSIIAQSEGKGQGSTFTVRLPLAPAQLPFVEEQVKEQEAPVALLPMRVLIVDDNIASAKTVGWMVEMMGYEYELSHDGLDALAKARELKPDIILLDIGLPRMNGYDVCRELRKDPQFKDTVFIAQTGWGQERDRQEARDAGFDHHLIKPVNFEEFSKLLTSKK